MSDCPISQGKTGYSTLEKWRYLSAQCGRDVLPKRRMVPVAQINQVATTQTHILGLGLTHPDIYFIYDQLESRAGSCQISRIGTNSRIFERSFADVLEMTVCHRTWTRPMTHFSECVAHGTDWTKLYTAILHDTLQLPVLLGWMRRCWQDRS